MKDIITDSKPFIKEKEELLPNGTLVTVKDDESKITRRVLWSIPDDFYPHRYCIEGFGFVCEKRDLLMKD